MTRHRGTRVGLLAAGLVAVLLAGCGGSGGTNGVEKLSVNDALDRVRHATDSVSSVHVVGTITQSGQTLGLDVRVGTGIAQGSVDLGGGKMELRLVRGVTYFRGDQKVFTAFGTNPALAALAAERWIKDTSSSGPAAGFSAFLDSHQLFQSLLTPQGKVSADGTTTIDGHKAFVLVDKSSDGGKLYVADTGAPLPLRIERNGTSSARIDFTDYNADVNVDVPPDAVDISKLGGG